MTPRPGRVAADIPVPLPRPRPSLAGNPIAAGVEVQVRAALSAVHAPELEGWAEPPQLVTEPGPAGEARPEAAA
jgi:hypothetical protein